MQPCRVCGCIKPLEEFTFRKESKTYRTECNSCRSSESTAKRYGVTVEAIEELKRKQNNCCAACGIHVDEIKHSAFKHNPLVIDHDHKTGKVRGLLCSQCNLILGHAHDSVDILQKVIDYLNGRQT